MPNVNQDHHAALRTAQTAPHRHVPRLIRNVHVHDVLYGMSGVGRFNASLAVWITRVVGTMYCAYLFAAIALIALPSALEQGSATVFVNWLSANFLQLILLPIIIVGQKVISAAEEARAEADHETLTALHGMAQQQIEILEGQNRILQLLAKKD
jgi:hypothetical protein